MLHAMLAGALLFNAMGRSLSGTLMTIETAPQAKLMVNAERQFQTFPVAGNALVERESRPASGETPAVSPIDLSDLTPGEYVELRIDSRGRVTGAKAIVDLERSKVRSASGDSVVLQDGTALTIGSVLRYTDAAGRPSATATVRPGDTVLLFRNPDTRNVYRFSAEPRKRTRSE